MSLPGAGKHSVHLYCRHYPLTTRSQDHMHLLLIALLTIGQADEARLHKMPGSDFDRARILTLQDDSVVSHVKFEHQQGADVDCRSL